MVVEENSRYYKIAGLLPNSEYVISLRARNLMGDGPPRMLFAEDLYSNRT